MRQESYSACNYWWVKFLFVSHVGICISLEHIVTTYICVEMPGTCNVKAEYQYPGISRPVLACLTGTLAPVFNLVGLSKLLTLPSAKPAHCFCSRDPVVSVKIDLQPLPHSMRDGLSRAPCSTFFILPGSEIFFYSYCIIITYINLLCYYRNMNGKKSSNVKAIIFHINSHFQRFLSSTQNMSQI